LRGLGACSQAERGRHSPPLNVERSERSDAPALEGRAVTAFAGPDNADADAFVGGDRHTRSRNDRVGPVDVSLDAVDGQLHLVGGDRFAVGPGDLDVGVVDPIDRPVAAGCGVVLGRVEVEREHAHRDHQRDHQNHSDDFQYLIAVVQIDHARTYPLVNQESAESSPGRWSSVPPSTTVLGVARRPSGMRRPALRVLMAVVGLTTLAVYLVAAYLVYLLVEAVWAVRPSPGTLLLSLAIATLLSAYVSYQVGTARLLRSVRAWELTPERAPALYRRLSAYSEELGIDEPHLLVGDVGQPNAFALGGGLGGGVVVVDRRLFGLLTLDELSAIVAHELAHIDNRDSLVQTFGFSALQTLTSLVLLAILPVLVLTTGFARGLAWLRGRPHEWERTIPGLVRRVVETGVSAGLFALTLGLLALSRRREFAADDRAATVTGDPLALARALRKIERATDPHRWLRSQLYVRGEEDDVLLRLLSTHPATDERVERLREHADERRSGPRRIEVE